MSFDWHAGPITRATPLDKHYRNTQKVRQFLLSECARHSSSTVPLWHGSKPGHPQRWAKSRTNGSESIDDSRHLMPASLIVL